MKGYLNEEKNKIPYSASTLTYNICFLHSQFNWQFLTNNLAIKIAKEKKKINKTNLLPTI